MKVFERLAGISAALAVALLLAGLAAAPVRTAQAANNANVCALGTCVGRGVPASPIDPTGCTPAGVCNGPPAVCTCVVGVLANRCQGACPEPLVPTP